jgi:integrase
MGSKERLAFALMLYLGQRRSDVAKLGPQHLEGNHIRLVQQKTRTPLLIPLHPELVVILEQSKLGQLAFIVSERGKPYTVEAFSNWFRKACWKAGSHDCPAHGLRKAAARRLAEAGAGANEIAAITGHKTLAEVARYTKEADQARLAESAMKKVVLFRSKG